MCGLAIVLHGSFHDRCALVFHVFNLAGDEGVSRAELTTMLTAILQSTDTILYTVCESGGAVLGGEERGEAVSMMVTEAFKHCDITRTGKLLPVVRMLFLWFSECLEGYNVVNFSRINYHYLYTASTEPWPPLSTNLDLPLITEPWPPYHRTLTFPYRNLNTGWNVTLKCWTLFSHSPHKMTSVPSDS